MKQKHLNNNSIKQPNHTPAPRCPRPSSGPAIDIFANILSEKMELYLDVYDDEYSTLTRGFRADKLRSRLRSLNSHCFRTVDVWIKIADLEISESNKFSAYLWLRNHVLRKHDMSWTLGNLHKWHSKKIGKRRRKDSKPLKGPREIPQPDAFPYDQMQKTNPQAYEDLSYSAASMLEQLLALHLMGIRYSYMFDGLWIEFRSSLAKTLTKERLRKLVNEWDRDDRRPSRLP